MVLLALLSSQALSERPGESMGLSDPPRSAWRGFDAAAAWEKASSPAEA